MPVKSQRKTARAPKHAPRTIAPRPDDHQSIPSPSLTSVPAQNRFPRSQNYLPAALANNIHILVILERRIKHMLHTVNNGLLHTSAEAYETNERAKDLHRILLKLRLQVKHDLVALGYIPTTATSYSIPKPVGRSPSPLPVLYTTSSQTSPAPQEHARVPTIAKETAKKAPKRKADNRNSYPQPPAKKLKADGGVKREPVDRKRGIIDEGSREVEEWRQPSAIPTKVKPLTVPERWRMEGWTWNRCIKIRAMKRKIVEECMMSPMGTVMVW